ncbi:membrane protease YdiL (CAAX protease family) [Lipingzhangella halophila]|uniref:Membrane protease YdiL (CAAX protease family) n=1 Tax=Lipingzhangella halophila TaxID=1783352 RepID=A0A7W7RCJ1_9ACTN|nr:type II CAAX endopeptidase family protein [Lipingzhangella halophila]MBB4929481.1 membrane protease YdiL (CAAX protease family) [Lipingzhangella halophila]
MVGTAVRRRVLSAGGAVFAAAVALLFVIDEPRIPAAGGYATSQIWRFWVPVVLGLLLIRWVPPRPPEQELANRVGATMAGRSVGRETLVLTACVLGFLAGETILTPMFGAVDPSLAPLSYHTAKVLFLLFIPLMLIGSSGVMADSCGSDLPRLATRVTERWRWAGLVPVAGYLLVVPFPLAAQPPELGSVPEQYDLVATLAIGYTVTALLEVVFFQGFLLTRLEILFGRWPGIVLMALVYALASLVGGSMPNGIVSAVAGAIAVQGAAALLYGYLWSRYRNIWLNVLLQMGIVTFIVLPVAEAAA